MTSSYRHLGWAQEEEQRGRLSVGVLGYWTPLNLGELGFLYKDVLLQRLYQVLLCVNQVSHVPYRREA